MQFYWHWLLVVFGLSFVLLAVVAAYVAKAGRDRVENALFTLFIALLAVQSLAQGLALALHAPPDHFLLSIDSAVTLALPATFLYFAYLFPSRSAWFRNFPRFPLMFGLGLTTLTGLLIGVNESGAVDSCIYENGPVCGLASPLGPWGLIYNVGAGVVAFALLWRKHQKARTLIEATRGRYLVMGFSFLVGGSLLAPLILLLGDYFGHAVITTNAVLTLLFAYTVGYAILRYQMFDVNVVFRRGLSITLTFLFMAFIWVAIGELMEKVAAAVILNVFKVAISDTTISIVSALIVAALITPVEKLSRRLLELAFPKLKTHLDKEALADRGVEIYRAALEEALADGVVKGRELHVLARLRASLGVSDADHLRLEAVVRRELGFTPTPVARSAARPAPSRAAPRAAARREKW